INTVREEYRVIAARASILFFTVADMARVENMYSYSLTYFVSLYKQRIQETAAQAAQEKNPDGTPAPPQDLPTRLQTLLKDLNLSLYLNICRGLFEKDKLLFAFLMAVGIGRGSGSISETEWAYFVRGPDAA